MLSGMKHRKDSWHKVRVRAGTIEGEGFGKPILLERVDLVSLVLSRGSMRALVRTYRKVSSEGDGEIAADSVESAALVLCCSVRR